ncbi:unnamed protein product [Lathyrus sativus]|nr:unnamed protein product [Lathyrus sativus]
MTVRETIDFSARCQGVGSRADIMTEITRKEKEQGIFPDPDIDTYMKAISVEGQSENLQTEYVLKILGLDICADRGISGGQKKRLTTVQACKQLVLQSETYFLQVSTHFAIQN